jgi:Ca2+-binding RTX toxin-like protein
MATDNSAFSTVQPNTVPRADNPYIDALAQVNKWSSNTTISFFLKGTWAGFESTAAQQAFQLFSNVANIKFQQVFTEAETNLILTKENKDKDDPDTLGRFNFPDADAVATNQITGIFYTEASGWNVDGLLQGGNGFVTLIHEIGHALGLAHPHDDGGGSSLFPGVVESEDLGTNALNQGVWTTMSYNDGLVANGLFGYQGSLMSFDIAAIQHIYGANTNYNSGSNVYTLPTSNTSGTYYQSIWDTGGNDTINASGASSIVTINLNAASLTGDDAGGFISSVSDVFGGYTIANGVTIENATGGSGDDILTGNDVDNKLDGGGGADTLIGEAGKDNLFGENGDDFLVGGTEADLLDGGNGNDTAFYFDATSGVELSLETSEGFLGDANGDRFVSIENIGGSEFSDLLIGNQENNILSGIGGDDRLYGQTGDDTLYGGKGRDRLFGAEGSDSLFGGEDNDVLYGLEGNDLLDGGDGDDQLDGSDGNDIIRGGLGIDTAIYNGRRSRYSITRINGGFTITSNDTGEGVDTVSYDVEKLQFFDQVVAINPAIPKLNNDVFTVINGSKAKPSVQFTVNSNGANQLGELGVFVVDDADGKIDGIAPNDNGYAQKALSKAKVIFSVLDNSPSGFSINGLSRLLEFNKSDKFRFYAIGDRATTTDSVLASGNFSKVNFLTATLLNFNENDGGSFINFNNLSINVKPSDDELPIGTGLQDQKEGEVLDLTKGFDTKVFSQVKADFTVNREAGFNNFVGFYKIENAKGDIKRADGSIVSVGQSGYIQAAVAGQVSGIDLSVDNQSTKTTSGVFSAGSIFAPFIIVNGNRDAILDNNPSNDPAVYFSFLGANSDKVDHIRLLGNNTFGFEDLAGGGDFDYNDIIVKVKLTPVA